MENVQLRKWSIVLLALLLVAMVIVPMVSAAEIPAVTQSDIKPLIYGQTPDKDMFAYLGIEKPAASVGPKWQTYDSSKKEVDILLDSSGKQNDVRKVIGYLKGNSENLVLYRGLDGNYYALLQKDGAIVAKTASVTVLGSKMEQAVDMTLPGVAPDATNKSSITTTYTVRKIALSDIGSSEFKSNVVYSTEIRRDDAWVSIGGKRADLFTDGVFTYDYANQILGLADNSNTYQGFGIDQCSFTHSPRVTGITGYIDSSVIWALDLAMPPKHSVNAWISCNVYGTTGGNSAISNWVSTGFGCFGVP